MPIIILLLTKTFKDQKAIFEIRKAGLNILMSMKGDKKAVAFIEDCAVYSEHLDDYTSKLKNFKNIILAACFMLTPQLVLCM